MRVCVVKVKFNFEFASVSLNAKNLYNSTTCRLVYILAVFSLSFTKHKVKKKTKKQKQTRRKTEKQGQKKKQFCVGFVCIV